jgi:signal transduction histidine kinase
MARATEPLFTTCPHGIKAGWGLSNCAGFIRQSGGGLSIESEPGRGTMVQISLPLEKPADMPTDPAEAVRGS